MIRELTPQDVLPLIVEYLRSVGLKKTAKQIDSSYEHEETPLQGRSLDKIIHSYIVAHPKLTAKFTLDIENESEQQNEEEEDEEQEQIPIKTVKTTKEEIFTRDGQQCKRKYSHTETTYEQIEPQPKKKFFQKVDDNLYHTLPEKLKDNSYEAKAKFGVGDEYGSLGNEKLKVTRGDSFKKEKGKLKNRQYAGNGSINTTACNGIKL